MAVTAPSRGLFQLLFAGHEALGLPQEALDGPTRNYEQMAALSGELGFKLYLSTFAAPSYDELDASARRFFEADIRYLWPPLIDVAHYRDDLAAYNDNLRRTASRLHARLIDVAAAVHGDRRFFNDNTHQLPDGRAVHAGVVADALGPEFGASIP